MSSQSDSSTSFIPGTGAAGRGAGKKGLHPDSLLLLVSSVLFLLVSAGWIGLGLYQDYLSTQIDARKDAFRAAEEEVLSDDSELQNLRLWGNRFSAINPVLDRHIAPAIIFGELEKVIKQGARFTSFSFSGNLLSDGMIELSGEAHNYATVIAQRAAFRESTFFSSPVFAIPTKESGEGEGAGSLVSFSLTAEVSPDKLRFASLYDSDELTPTQTGEEGTTTDVEVQSGTPTPAETTSAKDEGAGFFESLF